MNEITAYQCKGCSLVMYPAHLRCLGCNGRDFEEIHPQGQARLLTYTVVNELPWGIDERGRILGLVEFMNGVRALGLVKAEDPKLGMKLEPGWEPVRVIGGEKMYGLTLRPV